MFWFVLETSPEDITGMKAPSILTVRGRYDISWQKVRGMVLLCDRMRRHHYG
ncbi:MAG: hypothetical protein ACLUD0_11165 [Eubacterium ramulus]